MPRRTRRTKRRTATVPAWWRRWCGIRSHLFWWAVAGEARGQSNDVVVSIIKRRADAWRQRRSIS